jgi:hypothetical protein
MVRGAIASFSTSRLCDYPLPSMPNVSVFSPSEWIYMYVVLLQEDNGSSIQRQKGIILVQARALRLVLEIVRVHVPWLNAMKFLQ